MTQELEETGEEGICLSCGELCSVVMSDEGIGPYEYWGATGVHHDYQPVSNCCGDSWLTTGELLKKVREYDALKSKLKDAAHVLRFFSEASSVDRLKEINDLFMFTIESIVKAAK